MAILVLIGALVLVGIILRLLHREEPVSKTDAHEEPVATPEEVDSDGDGVCCGLHEICSKSAEKAGKIIYFDDDELDRFAHRKASDYTPGEIDEFRDVLLTLPPEEITQWQDSLSMRSITPPSELRDEMLLLLEEIAFNDPAKHQNDK